MRKQPVAEPLDLWRGIDDAVWREAMRAPPLTRLVEPLPAERRPAEAPPRQTRVPERV